MAGSELLPHEPHIYGFAGLRAFWHEVDAVRASVLRGETTAAGVPGSALARPADQIRARLLGVLKSQEAEVARAARGTPAAYREAHYLMAALADDVFLRLPWAGAAAWMWRPLELEVYGTRIAGQLVFDRIDRLTGSANPDVELAALYLIALSLGFEGQFAGQADRAPLDEYEQRLRRLIAGDRDTLERPLMPDCYAHTAVMGRGTLLHDARRWAWVALAVVVVWLVASSLAWRQVSAPVAAVSVPPSSSMPEQGSR